MAPPLTLTLSMSGSCTLAHDRATEANASLTSNRSMSAIVMPALCEHLAGGVDRTVEVVVGLGAHEHLGDDAGPGLQPERLRLVLGHPEHGGGAVGDLRAVAGGVDAVVEDGLELREPVDWWSRAAPGRGRRLAHAVLAVRRPRPARSRGRSDPRPDARAPSAASASAQASTSSRVMPRAGRDALGGTELVGQVRRVAPAAGECPAR